jgi:hypothetical protein
MSTAFSTAHRFLAYIRAQAPGEHDPLGWGLDNRYVRPCWGRGRGKMATGSEEGQASLEIRHEVEGTDKEKMEGEHPTHGKRRGMC